MAQILLGATAFPLAFAWEWVSGLRTARLKPILGLTSIAAFAGALAWILATPGRLGWPWWTALAGWPLLLAGGLLLVYSLFVEIPFAATYTQPAGGQRLVTSGTYALVRHPGVLWLGLALAGLVLISQRRMMLFGSAVWLVLDAVYVWLQEALLLRRVFPDYVAYQRTTPMLVPTRRSIALCLQSLGRQGRPLSIETAAVSQSAPSCSALPSTDRAGWRG